MPILPGDPVAAATDLNAALDALETSLRYAPPLDDAPVLEQSRFAAFFHS